MKGAALASPFGEVIQNGSFYFNFVNVYIQIIAHMHVGSGKGVGMSPGSGVRVLISD